MNRNKLTDKQLNDAIIFVGFNFQRHEDIKIRRIGETIMQALRNEVKRNDTKV